jgi:hypothetical protein
MVFMTIEFSKVELKAYPKLPLIQKGLDVIGLKGTKHEGMKGKITNVIYEPNQTKNSSILEIIVDFGDSQSICSEDELGFMFKEDDSFYTTAEGKAVCPSCYVPMDIVTEVQYDDITWRFQDGKYVKENGMGDTDGKRCAQCRARLDDDNDEVFPY